MRFFALLLTVSVGLGCATTRGSRNANSPEDGNEEEPAEQSEESEQPAEVDEEDGEDKERESRPAKKRRPKRRRHVQAAPAEPEPAPIARAAKPPPPPVAPPPPEEPAPAYTESSTESVDQGDDLEAEARKRCHWKKVAPYRPEWANSISPPVSRKITSKPICSYGTPPAVLRVARQIAVRQTKLNKR